MAAYKDRISELPDALLHEIMSKIPIKYAARFSILSKRWNCIWQTLPFLHFDEEFYSPNGGNWKPETHRKNAYLMRKAKQIILSRCRQQQQQTAESVTNLQELCWAIPDDKKWEDFNLELEFETLMHNLAKTGLRKLSTINQSSKINSEYPNLPSPLILPRSINKLHLRKLGLGGLKSLLPGPGAGGIVKFECLRTLNLYASKVKDEVLNELNATCPSLEDLEMRFCVGLKNLHLTGLTKLKRLSLRDLWTLRTLKIEFLPQLRILTIRDTGSFGPVVAVDLNNTLCDFVRHLELFGEFLNDNLLNGFVYKCRLLEHLGIGCSKAQGLEQVSISMDTIQVLSIAFVEKLAEVEVRAPMLRQFSIKTAAYNRPPTISWKHSNPPPPKVDVTVHSRIRSDWTCFIPDDDKLEMWRNFFGYFNYAKELQLQAPSMFLNWVKREGSLSHSPLCSVEELVFLQSGLDLCESSPVEQLLESLMFLAPRATSLSMSRRFGITIPDIIFKFVYDEKEICKTSSSNQSHPFGIETWLQSVSEVIIQKFNGEEDDLKELNNLFSKIKNLKISMLNR